VDIELLRALLPILRQADDAADGAQRIFERRREFLVPLRAGEAEIEAGVLDRFAPAFDALELAILACRAFANFYREAEPRLLDDIDVSEWGAHALTQLFYAGVLIAAEVLTLMRGGYHTGAFARWRALHEVATRIEVISGAGDLLLDTAERYVRHEQFRENGWLALERGLDRKLNPNDSTLRDVLRDWEAENAEGIQEYGDAFRAEYGWAENLLRARSPAYMKQAERENRPRGPVFDDLFELVRHDGEDPPPVRWRILYALANGAVHGSALRQWEAGEGGSTLLIGPHLGVFGEIGAATAHRLRDLTRAFVQPDYGVPTEEADHRESSLSLLSQAVAHLAGMAESAFALTDLTK
jgi:hypothetical protein